MHSCLSQALPCAAKRRQPAQAAAYLLALLAVYSLVNWQFIGGPLFEGPDELEHYRYAYHIASTGTLPHPSGQQRGQYHQPPLYYLLLSPLVRALNAPAPEAFNLQLNPHYPYQIDVFSNDNKAVYLHPCALEQSAGANAVRSLRLVSWLCGLLTLVFCYLAAREIFPQQRLRQRLMLSLAAFTPQFVYITSVINNDALLIALSSALLYAMVRALRRPNRSSSAFVIGSLYGAVLLTKTNGLFLGVVWLLFGLAQPRPVKYILQTGLTSLVVVGAWYARNALLYDDLFLTRHWQITWADDVISGHGWQVAVSRLPYSYATVWARFGSGAVAVSSAVTRLFDALLALSGVGLVLHAGTALHQRLSSAQAAAQLKTLEPRLWALVALSAGVWLVALFYLASTAWSGIQGRYVLPGIAAWSALFSLGLSHLMPKALRRSLTAGLCAGLFVSLQLSLNDFQHTYAPIPGWADTKSEASRTYTFGEAVELRVVPRTYFVRPGELFEVELEWHGIRAAADSTKVFLHSLDWRGEAATVVRRDSYPATGNLSAQDWVGLRWRDRFVVRLGEDTVPQQAWQLIVGVYDGQTGELWSAVSETGAPEENVTAGYLAVPSPPRAAPVSYLAQFGASWRLFDYRLDPYTGQLCLSWHVLKDSESDYQRFVHYWDQAGRLLAQTDGGVHRGVYPTRFWRAGEQIEDCLDSPDVAFSQITVGWYDLNTLERPPAYDAQGKSLEHRQWGAGVSRPLN